MSPMKRAILSILALGLLAGCAQSIRTPVIDYDSVPEAPASAAPLAARYKAALDLLKAEKWSEGLANLETLESDIIKKNRKGNLDDLLEQVAETRQAVANYLDATAD